MSRTMTEVLIEHAFHMVTPVRLYEVNGPWQVECNCTADPIQGPDLLGAEAAFAAHQAAALSAAGFGLVADAKREAWDAGMMDQFEADLLGKPSPQNPYRDKLPLRRRGQQAGNKPTEPQTEVIYPPDPEWGTDPHGRFWYQDYDGESLHVWRNKDGELWIDKRGQGPVYVRAEDIPVIAAAVRGEDAHD